jgi:hypothetical protein
MDDLAERAVVPLLQTGGALKSMSVDTQVFWLGRLLERF